MDDGNALAWHCPDDGQVLRAEGRRGTVMHDVAPIQVCHGCRGNWLPGALVGAFVSVPAPKRLREVGAVSVRRCPVDGNVLLAIEHHDIEIDVCAVCFGIWLDAGELDKLLSDRQNDDELDDDWDEVFDFATSSDVTRRGQRSSKDEPAHVPARSPDGDIVPVAAEAHAQCLPGDDEAEAVPAPLDATTGIDADVDTDVLAQVGDAVGSVFAFIADAFSSLD